MEGKLLYNIYEHSTDRTGKRLVTLFGINVFASKFHILEKKTFNGMTSQYLSLSVISVIAFSKKKNQ